jgi:hypothetical protein
MCVAVFLFIALVRSNEVDGVIPYLIDYGGNGGFFEGRGEALGAEQG